MLVRTQPLDPREEVDLRFKATEGELLKPEELVDLLAPFASKFGWFKSHGYDPHYWQTLFHAMSKPLELRRELKRFRILVAGRRGGKTLSAAWEVLFYLLHPAQFHMDAHGKESDEPLWVWLLTKDYKSGRPALITWLKVLRQAGLKPGVDYVYNKTEKTFEFPDGTLLEVRSADDPEQLRGPGLDILWIDEGAFIPTQDAYNVVYPALSDKLGLVVMTTTPKGKNWVWDEFFNEDAQADPDIASVEYWSIHNPYFSKAEWERVKRRYHPLMFRQEYMAAFDAMTGIELPGDWLKYYSLTDPDGDEIGVPRKKDNKKQLDVLTYMAVDPAVSLSDNADHFAMALIGVTTDNSQAFLLEIFKGRLPFAEQLDKIREWHLKYRPTLIGIEAQAYQAVLAQQAMRLPNMPPVVPMFAKGKKSERIIAMSPLFKIGRVRIRKDQRDFIDEWLNYDSALKKPRDDVLDAVEMALRTAGVLLESIVHEDALSKPEDTSIQGLARRDLPKYRREEPMFIDDDLGAEI